MSVKRLDQCFHKGCGSRTCHFRVFTRTRDFDEVACRTHTRDLEEHADATLGDRWRANVTSSDKVKRERKAVKA